MADLTKWKLVPVEPTEELLRSMAVRYDHGLGCPGYYDQFGEGEQEKRLRATMTTMRQLHEEVVGTGFYRSASPAPSLPTREEIARVLEPQAWAVLGLADTLAYKNRRTSSLRKADAILALFAQPQEKKLMDGNGG